MITADTITDEQIRELFYEACDRGDRHLSQLAQTALGDWRGSHKWRASDEDFTSVCITCGENPAYRDHVDAARARCAEILSARTS